MPEQNQLRATLKTAMIEAHDNWVHSGKCALVNSMQENYEKRKEYYNDAEKQHKENIEQTNLLTSELDTCIVVIKSCKEELKERTAALTAELAECRFKLRAIRDIIETDTNDGNAEREIIKFLDGATCMDDLF